MPKPVRVHRSYGVANVNKWLKFVKYTSVGISASEDVQVLQDMMTDKHRRFGKLAGSIFTV